MRSVVVVLGAVLLLAVTGMAKELVIHSVKDSGIGTLRWALETARSGDTIAFDSEAFPPSDPATITLEKPLPPLICGSLTIDASDAGVILSGRNLRGGDVNALEVVSSGNVVRGLQILDFTGCGFFIAGPASSNTIGGERTIGTGPFGQGNAVRRCNGGIGIWGEAATRNLIVGNVVGTDASGIRNLGNIDGVAIGDGATGNVVGPGNVIAHNREAGVLITARGTSGNTITQNAIYENGWAGIRFEEEGVEDARVVLGDSNLRLGMIEGTTCPGCTVELFSDSDSEGKTYEGRAIADVEGRFQLAAGSSFSGPAITVTVTQPDGTTGPFSTLAHVLEDTEGIQLENPHVVGSVAVRTSDKLEDNRLAQLASLFNPASDAHSQMETENLLRQHVDLGLTWLRLSLDWLDWCEVVRNPRFSSTDVDPIADVAITMLNDHDVDVMLCLVYWDDAISTVDPPARMYSTAEETGRYVHYVRSIVRHFRGRVASYALLNEPNVPEPGQFVTPEDYVELVRRTVPAIRAEDHGSKIVIGEVTPLWGCDGLDYLYAILDPNVLRFVDGIAWHWGGASPELHADFYYGYPALVRDVRRVAEERGFEGEMLAEEITLRTAKTPHPSEYMGYEEIPALKYTLRIALMNLGLDLAAGLNFESLEEIPMLERMTQVLCTVMAGHEAIDLPVDIDIETDGPVAQCAFRYPNGDRMLAIWTDGIAQDEDPGVPATIRFPGLAAAEVTGIDVLRGFEQELVFEAEDGDTVVRDLLVKDYPILIRLSDIAFRPDYEEAVGDGFHRIGDADALTDGAGDDRDGDGVPDDEDFCPDWPGSEELNGC